MENIFKFSLFCVVVVFCESRDSPSVSDFNLIRVPRSTSDSDLIILKRQIEKMGTEMHTMKEDFVKLEENFNEKLVELEEKVVNKIHGISDDVKRLSDGLESLQTELAEVSNKADSTSEKIRVDIEQVTQKVNKLNTRTKSGLDSTKSRLDSTKSLLNGRIDDIRKDLESTLSVSLNQVTQKVNELNTTTKSGLDSTKSILNGRIDEIKKDLESKLSVSLNQNFNEKLVELEEKVVSKIHGNSDDVKRLSDELESLHTELAEVSNKADSIKEKIRVDIEQVAQKVNKLDTTTKSGLDSTQSLLNGRIDQIKKDFESKLLVYLNKVSQKVNDLNLTTKSGLDSTKSVLNGRIDEIKKDLESKLSVSLNQITGKTTIGKVVSLLESNEREDQREGCGGIVVADEGFISFKPDPSRVNTQFTCIWTIRANLYKKVAFKLKRGNLGADMDTILFVSPLNAYIFNNVSDSWAIRRDSSATVSSLNKAYSVSVGGPVVFLTLVANISSSSSPEFQIYFKGHGEYTSSSTKYRHYHFEASEGELDYPKIRGVDTYSPNEVSTFVINPHPPRILLLLLKVDLETHSDCELDALTILQRWNNYSNSYIQTGHPQYVKHWRYCMADTNTTGSVAFPSQKAYIVIFNSNESNQKSGFKLSWQEK